MEQQTKKRSRRSKIPIDSDDASMASQNTNNAGTSRQVHFDNRRPERTFCHLVVKTNPSKKGTEELANKLKNVLRILQDGDEGVLFTIYVMDDSKDNQNLHVAEPSVSVTKPSEIPITITKMARFFQGARPRANGGQVYLRIRLLHQIPFVDLLANCVDELRENNMILTPQKYNFMMRKESFFSPITSRYRHYEMDKFLQRGDQKNSEKGNTYWSVMQIYV